MAVRSARAGGGVIPPDTEVRQQLFPPGTDGVEGMHLSDIGPGALRELRAVVAVVPKVARGLDERLPRPVRRSAQPSLADHAVGVTEQRENRNAVTPCLEVCIRPAFDGRRADESDRSRQALLEC